MTSLDPVEIAHVVEFGEAAAYADLIRAAPADLATSLGLTVTKVGSAIALTMRAVDILLFNRVMGLGLVEPALEAMVDEVVAHYRSQGLKHFGFQLSPAAQPAALPEWIKARGFQARDNWVKVIRGSEPAPQIDTDLRVDEIGSEHRRGFSTVALTAFGMPESLRPWLEAPIGRPGWHCYAAFDGEQAVGAGALFVKGEVAWLGVGSTLPSHRGRRAQGAIMARRIRDAIALGCRWIVTETGEETPQQPNPSWHNMLRTGFRLVYPRPNYVFSGGV